MEHQPGRDPALLVGKTVYWNVPTAMLLGPYGPIGILCDWIQAIAMVIQKQSTQRVIPTNWSNPTDDRYGHEQQTVERFCATLWLVLFVSDWGRCRCASGPGHGCKKAFPGLPMVRPLETIRGETVRLRPAVLPSAWDVLRVLGFQSGPATHPCR